MGLTLTYLRLLQCVTKPDFDIDELESIIGVDVSVTHALMRYLGSAAFGLRGDVRDIRHGLVLLGREQTRRFVSLVALGEMGRHKPSEILVTAATRAKFCEMVGTDLGLEDRRSELFLVGALSLVDAMLDQPMSQVLAELPLADDLRQALLGGSSPLRPALEFVERYERGDWLRARDSRTRLESPGLQRTNTTETLCTGRRLRGKPNHVRSNGHGHSLS